MGTDYERDHRHKIERLYRDVRYPDAVDLWAAFFARSEDEIIYSNWRHLNRRRQDIENSVWKRYIKDGDLILEIGCGKGFFLKRVNDSIRRDITIYGLDISKEIIRIAGDYFPQARYVIADAEHIPFKENIFNYIQIISTLEYVMHPDMVINEAVRVLRPGGSLYIELHKNAFDPLLLPTFYRIVSGKFKRILDTRRGQSGVRYSMKFSDCRKLVFHSLHKNNMVLVEKGCLIGYIELWFYQRLGLSHKWFMQVAELANRLPFKIFKNLEYFLYKKVVP